MAQLLQETKDECGITWDDEITDRKMAGILSRAKAVLDKYAGQPVYYDEDLSDRQLLLSLCRYIYNNAFEEFSVAFSGEITALRQKYEAIRQIEKDGDTSGTE